MTRGKHAEVARSKREAEVRYATQVRETNRLRAEVRELRHLREENERMRTVITELRADLDAKVAPDVARLTEELETARGKNELLAEKNRAWGDLYYAVIDDMIQGMRLVKPRQRNDWRVYHTTFAAAVAPTVSADPHDPPFPHDGSDDEQTAWLEQFAEHFRKQGQRGDHLGKKKRKYGESVRARKRLRELEVRLTGDERSYKPFSMEGEGP